MNAEPDRVYFSEAIDPEDWDACAVPLNPVRLDPELWRPPLQWHPPVDHEAADARREWRRRNRPFRRAFVGGEARRNALLKAGLAMAAERDRKAAGL